MGREYPPYLKLGVDKMREKNNNSLDFSPVYKSGENKAKVSITLDRDLLEKLKQYNEIYGTNISNFINNQLRFALNFRKLEEIREFQLKQHNYKSINLLLRKEIADYLELLMLDGLNILGDEVKSATPVQLADKLSDELLDDSWFHTLDLHTYGGDETREKRLKNIADIVERSI
mgnify:CR=1 FL=1